MQTTTTIETNGMLVAVRDYIAFLLQRPVDDRRSRVILHFHTEERLVAFLGALCGELVRLVPNLEASLNEVQNTHDWYGRFSDLTAIAIEARVLPRHALTIDYLRLDPNGDSVVFIEPLVYISAEEQELEQETAEA